MHRCGRTGRAGKTGKAVTFFTGEAHEKSLAGEFMRVLRDAGAEVSNDAERRSESGGRDEMLTHAGAERDGQIPYDHQEEG